MVSERGRSHADVMSQSQHDSTAGRGAPGGDWWSRRPRRSATDRKIAGVAGGLGRALGVDPVLMRVGFVVLMIFGVGVPLYLLGWLLLPADGDQTSAAESLIGRGRSSVPPVLAVGLAILLMISMGWMFSWGSPFWPLLVVGIIAVMVARRRRENCTGRGGPRTATADDWSARVGQRAQSWGEQAEQWVGRQSWSGSGSSSTVTGDGDTGGRPGGPKSPFEKPPFWEQDGRRSAADGPAAADAPSEPTPPAWDPLGVAPFAWDLPEPTPLPTAPPARQTDRGVVGRVTLGVALLVGGLATAGVFAGWWNLSWAAVAASALAVVAVGLLIGSLRGRGMALIGPGIFLSLVTIALTITGISGVSGYGQHTWTPTTVAAAESSDYVLNGGQGTLDLTQLTVPAGQRADVNLEVHAGQAQVIVPADTTVNAICTTNAGQVNCLDETASGLHKEISPSHPGSSDNGTINLTVHVGAGEAEVTSRG